MAIEYVIPLFAETHGKRVYQSYVFFLRTFNANLTALRLKGECERNAFDQKIFLVLKFFSTKIKFAAYFYF